MPYFSIPPADPHGDADRQDRLQKKIDAIASDLKRVDLFPEGKDSLIYQSLHSAWKYWKSVQENVLASEIEQFDVHKYMEMTLQSAKVIENKLEQIAASMEEESSPADVSPGGEHKAVNPPLYLSEESKQAIRGVIQHFRDNLQN